MAGKVMKGVQAVSGEGGGPGGLGGLLGQAMSIMKPAGAHPASQAQTSS